MMSKWVGEGYHWAGGGANKLQVGSGGTTAMQLVGESYGFPTLESQVLKGCWG